MRALGIIGASAIGLTALAAGHLARAADLSPAYPAVPVYNEPDPQFEFGTGWYLRGDASYASEDQAKLDPAFGRLSPDWGYGAGGGIGYRFNSIFRADITGDYLEPIEGSRRDIDVASGNTVVTKVSLNRYDGLVNGYVDLGNWYGVTPYVGAGVGFSVLDPSGKLVVTNAFGNSTGRKLNFTERTNFAWAAMAGVSYAVDPSVVVDLGYRHLDLGRASVAVGSAVLNRDITRDEVRLGLRYMLN